MQFPNHKRLNYIVIDSFAYLAKDIELQKEEIQMPHILLADYRNYAQIDHVLGLSN